MAKRESIKEAIVQVPVEATKTAVSAIGGEDRKQSIDAKQNKNNQIQNVTPYDNQSSNRAQKTNI